MALFDRQLNEVWQSLRAKRVPEPNELVEVRIRNLRGIRDLTVPLDYPVSVFGRPKRVWKIYGAICLCLCVSRSWTEPKRLHTLDTFPKLRRGWYQFSRFSGKN